MNVMQMLMLWNVNASLTPRGVTMAMTITVNSLLPRPKLDCDGGYDAAVRGSSVVVHAL
jgi:hypothetical protein